MGEGVVNLGVRRVSPGEFQSGRVAYFNCGDDLKRKRLVVGHNEKDEFVLATSHWDTDHDIVSISNPDAVVRIQPEDGRLPPGVDERSVHVVSSPHCEVLKTSDDGGPWEEEAFSLLVDHFLSWVGCSRWSQLVGFTQSWS